MKSRRRSSFFVEIGSSLLVAAIVAAGTPSLAHGAALEFVEVQVEGQAGVSGLAGVLAVAVSPDGRDVYVAGASSNALAVFRTTKER